MKYVSFNLSKSIFYYKGGEFRTDQPWQHQAVYHHGDYELIFCLQGQIFLTLNQQQLVLKPHDLLIVPPYCKMVGNAKSPVGTAFYWLHFLPQERAQITEQAPASIAPMINAVGQSKHQQTIFLPLKFAVANFEEVTVLIHQILASTPPRPYLDDRNLLTAALLIKLFAGTATTESTRADQRRVATVQEWIRAHMSSQLTVEEIADHNNFNPDYLTRMFKRVLGVTTRQYLNRIKIETASSLLIRTGMPIKEVAANSFFSDTRTFLRRFKAMTGLTPTEYRQSNREIHHNNPHIDPQIPLPKQIEDLIDYIPENGNLK